MALRQRFFSCSLRDFVKVYFIFIFSEWYWECFLKQYFLKTMAVITGIMSVAVVWSEMTFFCKKPVLSIFANIVIAATDNYNYKAIEVRRFFSIRTGCTVLKKKSFGAPITNEITNERVKRHKLLDGVSVKQTHTKHTGVTLMIPIIPVLCSRKIIVDLHANETGWSVSSSRLNR